MLRGTCPEALPNLVAVSLTILMHASLQPVCNAHFALLLSECNELYTDVKKIWFKGAAARDAIGPWNGDPCRRGLIRSLPSSLIFSDSACFDEETKLSNCLATHHGEHLSAQEQAHHVSSHPMMPAMNPLPFSSQLQLRSVPC